MNDKIIANPAARCTFRFVDKDGHVETCRAKVVCEVCQCCSRLDGQKEHGHCPGHLGLLDSISVPGQDGKRIRQASDQYSARPNRPNSNKRPPRKQRRSGMGSSKGA